MICACSVDIALRNIARASAEFGRSRGICFGLHFVERNLISRSPHQDHHAKQKRQGDPSGFGQDDEHHGDANEV